MNNFNKGDQSNKEISSNNNNRKGGFSGGKGGNRKNMYQATCSDCGVSCEVPFLPKGDKPVYCKACFQKHRSNNLAKLNNKGTNNFSNKPSNQNSGSGNNEDYKAQLEQMNIKLDRILKILVPVISEETKVLNDKVSIKAPKKAAAKAASKKSAAKKPAMKKKK
jgi:CxxC-x17-CxxC domain-containing protein